MNHVQSNLNADRPTVNEWPTTKWSLKLSYLLLLSITVFAVHDKLSGVGEGNEQQRNQNARFLVFVGPHKTGSTTLQTWFYSHEEFLLENGWVWPGAGVKEFCKLVYALTRWEPMNPKCKETKWVLDWRWHWWKSTIYEHLHNGKNVVISSEEFDLANDDQLGRLILEGLKKISFSVEVIAMIRFPRWKHMLSLWKEIQESPVIPGFEKWICDSFRSLKDNRPGVILVSTVLRPYRLARKYQSGGFKTTLVNYTAIKRDKYMKTVVQHFLQLNISNKETQQVLNARHYDHDLGEEQINRLETVLSAYDCYEGKIDGLSLMNMESDYVENCDSEKLNEAVQIYVDEYCD